MTGLLQSIRIYHQRSALAFMKLHFQATKKATGQFIGPVATMFPLLARENQPVKELAGVSVGSGWTSGQI
jgi:hypothetical protein